MNFVYTGFTHETTGIRLYSFEEGVTQGIRKGFLVSADIALLTKHHVRIQEVPMMCLRLLENSAEAVPQLERMALSERDMAAHALVKGGETGKGKKRPFKPTNPIAAGMIWKS